MSNLIIPGAEPFFLPASNKHGVLLVHGFTGNPAEMLLLGQHLHQNNLSVLAVRLAGHSTNEDDLARTSHFDWLNSVFDGFHFLQGFCENVSVVGYSMGGSLALRLAQLSNLRIHKLVSLATPIFIHHSIDLSLLPPLADSVGKFTRKPKRYLSDVPDAVNQTYRLMPLVSVHHLLDLIEIVKSNLVKVSVPTLIVHGVNDHTASPISADFIFNHISSDVKVLNFIPDTAHRLLLDVQCRDSVFKLVSDFLV